MKVASFTLYDYARMKARRWEVNMIDMHTHILPGIDDGAASLEEAILLTECLSRQKVTLAVCTPHFYPMEVTMEEFVANRTKALESIDHSNIQLVVGSETYLHEFLFHYNDLRPLCIGHSNFLLVEFPFMKVWKEEYGLEIKKISEYYNINPIIAHIDRYKPLLNNKRLLKRLKDMGCLLQMNTGCIISKKTRRKALRLIEEKYVDLLGTDCHNISYRPPIFEEACKIIQNKTGADTINRLMSNALAVVTAESSKTF